MVQGLVLLAARGILEMDRTGAEHLDPRGLLVPLGGAAVIVAIIATMRRPFLATSDEEGR